MGNSNRLVEPARIRLKRQTVQEKHSYGHTEHLNRVRDECRLLDKDISINIHGVVIRTQQWENLSKKIYKHRNTKGSHCFFDRSLALMQHFIRS